MNAASKTKVLFVCMGNICRSPTAEGVFRHIVAQQGLSHLIDTDSAGTHAYHVGETPDRRAQATAISRGLDISDLRARRVSLSDFSDFDYVIAMDKDNHSILLGESPAELHEKIYMFLDFAPDLNIREVPDPYYGGQKGFENVFDMVEAASRGLLEDIKIKKGID